MTPHGDNGARGLTGYRRVVSGMTAEGKSIIVSDELVEARGVPGTIAVAPLWGDDAPPRFPLDGTRPCTTQLFPGPGGYRFLIMVIPPDGEALATSTHSNASGAGEGAQTYMEADEPGMHTTDTVDFEVVLSGEATQEFDDGLMVHLKAGDTFIQNGTRHRWTNRGNVPAVVAVILIGGHPRDRGGA